MTTKHSPLPWTKELCGIGKLFTPQVISGTTKICVLPALSNASGKESKDSSEIMANCNLISAAPDLLAACKGILEMVSSAEYNFDDRAKFAKAAIERAEGKQ